MEMLLTGEMLGAVRAQELGLINQVVPVEELDSATDSLAMNICNKPPLAIRIGKQAFYNQLEYGLQEAYVYTSAVMVRNMMTEDAAEGIDAFLEKRKPNWQRK